jgi:hypothetical protein
MDLLVRLRIFSATLEERFDECDNCDGCGGVRDHDGG